MHIGWPIGVGLAWALSEASDDNDCLRTPGIGSAGAEISERSSHLDAGASQVELRAFLIECTGQHWLDIGRRLAERHGIAPALWTGDGSTVGAARGIFPGLVGIVGVDASRGQLPAEAGWPQTPLDEPLLRALAPEEAIGLAMMDRMDPATGAFDHDARRRHWHDLLRQWGAALDALRPDVVIFAMVPHVVYDYALYALCKHRNVPTRMFERSALPGSLFVVSCFEDGSAALRSALQGPFDPARLSVAARAHVAGLRAGGEAALPANYRKKLAKQSLLSHAGRQRDAGILRTLAREAVRAVYLIVRRHAAPANYFVREDRRGRLTSPNLLGWLVNRWRGQWRKWRLRRWLAQLARSVDLATPYVLLALHYQPERAIVPMAGALGDQLLIVDMLARTIPDGWTLVVKEHPWQLTPFGWGELARTRAFYRRIADYPNVRLAPLDSDSQRLLRGARAVATATGSIGWQAIALRIPALVFGAAWYRDAPGVFRIGDLASCRRAIDALTTDAAVPADAAERMLAAIERVAVPGFLEPGLEAAEHVSQSDAVAAMSAALAASIAAPQAPRAAAV